MIQNLINLLFTCATYLISHTSKNSCNTDGHFITYSGTRFSLLNPTIDMINIDDIALGLAYKPHFSGFTPKFFSIAEHSIIVYKLYKNRFPDDIEGQLCALLHDASESYTNDIIKPLKNLLPNFVVIENRISKTIYEKYGLDYKSKKDKVKYFDIIVQDIESNLFYNGVNSSIDNKEIIEYLNCDLAKSYFKELFNELYIKLKTNENSI